MRHYKATIKDEINSITVITVMAEGKEQAIDTALEKLWKLDYRRYMRVTSVDIEDQGEV